MVASDQEVIVQSDFSGGLNISVPGRLIADNEVQKLTNFEIGHAGELFSRPGVDATADLAFSTQDWFFVGTYKNGTGNPRAIGWYSTDGATAALQEYQSGAFAALSGLTLTPGLYSGHKRLLEYNNKAYLLTEARTIIEITNSTAANLAGTPLIANGIIFKDRMFGVIANSQQLLFTDIADFASTGWDAANFIDIEGEDATPIKAFAILNDTLIIFKHASVWALYIQGDPSNWVLRNLSLGLGCISYRGVAVVDNNLYFISSRGIFRTDGVNFENIGVRVWETQTLAILEKAEVVQWNRRVVFRITGTSHYVYYYLTDAWAKWLTEREIQYLEYYAHTTDIVKEISTALHDIVFDSLALGINISHTQYSVGVWKESLLRDEGFEGFKLEVETKDFDFQYPHVKKRLKWGALEYKGDPSNGALTISSDDTGNTEVFDLGDTIQASFFYNQFPAVGYNRFFKYNLLIDPLDFVRFHLLYFVFCVSIQGRQRAADN